MAAGEEEIEQGAQGVASVAVVTLSPVIRSGATKDGVKARPASSVNWVAEMSPASTSRSLAIPKSRSFTRPSFDTMTFDGFRSR
jgi:hypothetical protein